MTGPAVPSGLEALLARHGAWDARDLHTVAALAPDAVRLLIDMAEEMDRVQRGWTESMSGHFRRKALLARFAALDQRAGTA